jgi:hypothetical protein
MQTTEEQQLLIEILNYAQEGKFIEFRLIRSWNEFIGYWQDSKATKLVIKALRIGAEDLFKSYCEDIVSGSTDVNKLLAFTQLQDVIAFYERDLDTLKRMLDEYDEYLGNHFWYSFLGGERDI